MHHRPYVDRVWRTATPLTRTPFASSDARPARPGGRLHLGWPNRKIPHAGHALPDHAADQRAPLSAVWVEEATLARGNGPDQGKIVPPQSLMAAERRGLTVPTSSHLETIKWEPPTKPKT